MDLAPRDVAVSRAVAHAPAGPHLGAPGSASLEALDHDVDTGVRRAARRLQIDAVGSEPRSEVEGQNARQRRCERLAPALVAREFDLGPLDTGHDRVHGYVAPYLDPTARHRPA